MKIFLLPLFFIFHLTGNSQVVLSKNRICNCLSPEDIGNTIPDGFNGCILHEDVADNAFYYFIYKDGEEVEVTEYISGKLKTYDSPNLREEYDDEGRISQRIVKVNNVKQTEFQYIVDKKGRHYLNLIINYDAQGNFIGCSGKGRKQFMKSNGL